MAEGTIRDDGIRRDIRIEGAIVTDRCIDGITIDIENRCIPDLTTGIANRCIPGGTPDITGICIPTGQPTGITDNTEIGKPFCGRIV
jgi:hypothetical protein